MNEWTHLEAQWAHWVNTVLSALCSFPDCTAVEATVLPTSGLGNEDFVGYFPNKSFLFLRAQVSCLSQASSSVLNSNGIRGSWQKGPQRGLVQLTAENPISLFILSCAVLRGEESESRGNANNPSRFAGEVSSAPCGLQAPTFTNESLKWASAVVPEMWGIAGI